MNNFRQGISRHIAIGKTGEDVALDHYLSQGYRHRESNYRAKTGEIDLIVEKNGMIHFVEVKTVSRGKSTQRIELVPHGTWRPEENVHAWKLRKLTNTVRVWLSHRKYQGDWQIDVASVYLDVPHGTHTVEIIENVIVE